jgi:hypothetical protein
MDDLQTLTDRMLESENLTDNLQDQEAQWLLDWGITELRRLASEAENEQELSDRAGALMKFIRGLNRLVGGLPDADPAELARLLESHFAAYGTSRAAEQAAIDEAVIALSALPPREALEFLIGWVKMSDQPL